MASLRWKISLAYVLMVLIAATAAGLLMDQALTNHFLREKQVGDLTQANIVAGLIRHDLDSPGDIRVALAQFEQNLTGRILVTDGEGAVIFDSFGGTALVGQRLRHGELQSALRGTADSRPHLLPEEGWVTYTAVPVVNNREVVGAVFLSSPAESVVARLRSIETTLGWLAGGLFLAVILASLFVAARITGPIQRLTAATRRMAAGDLRQRVRVNSKDEIAVLGRSFNRMAEQLSRIDEARRSFVGNVSHELRSPLSSMKALVESLLHDRQSSIETYKEFLADINLELDRLGRLVNDLLVLTRIDQGEQPLRQEEVDLGQLVGSVLRRLGPLAKERDVTLEAEIAAGARVLGDPEQLARVLWNLVDNGIKYTEAGGRVTVRVAEQGPTAYRIEVRDTGSGIPAELLPHVFDRFTRADKARARATGGFGLGLTIAKEIVELHGGGISAASRPGEGSVFAVLLPVRPQQSKTRVRET